MSLLDLGLHLREQRGLLCPETAKQPCLALSFSLPFSLTSLSFFLSFFFPPNRIEREGSELFALVITAWGCRFTFPDSKGAGTGSLAPHSSHLPHHCKSSR